VEVNGMANNVAYYDMAKKYGGKKFYGTGPCFESVFDICLQAVFSQ
jgi:hypothetical protein